jgi:AcrR family transcriptional regulator
MAYRKLDHIDEKIVDAALRLGGSVWPDAGFATHDIAVRCGVSETVIFKHFQTKEKLLAFARAKASVTLNHSAEMIAEKTTDLSIFAHEFFAYLVAHSQLTYFILNYGSEIPHGEGTGENFSLENQESLANPPSFLGGNASEAVTQSLKEDWDYFLRHLLYLAGLSIKQGRAGGLTDPETMIPLLLHGLRSARQKEQE